MLEPKINQESTEDICLMRVKTIGKDRGNIKTTVINMVEKYDCDTKFLAMEKWTGWHASIVMIEILNNNFF